MIGSGGDFASARDDVTDTAGRANVALSVAVTSLVVGGAVQAWEIYRGGR